MNVQTKSRRLAPPADGIDDLLLPAANAYYQTGDLRAFMDWVSPWMLDYVARRLNRDPDIAGDFYVHSYDRVERFLSDYKTRGHGGAFTAYFSVCLRNEFMNFIRLRRRGVREQGLTESMLPQARSADGALPHSTDRDGEVTALYRYVDELPLEFRLPLKLVHGLDPDLDELHELVRLAGSAEEASSWMREFHERRQRRTQRLRRIEDRAAHLSFLIDSQSAGRPSEVGRRWSRWKRRLTELMRDPRPLFSLSELGTLYGRNKTTIMRRLDRALQLLRAESQRDPHHERLAEMGV